MPAANLRNDEEMYLRAMMCQPNSSLISDKAARSGE
jgi:hypothetical protein